MILIEPDMQLTPEQVGLIVMRHVSSEMPKLSKYRKYFDGEQAIMGKTYNDSTKPCNRIVTNYCDNIVNNYNGYLTGLPVSYNSQDNIDDIQEVLKYNDVAAKDGAFLRSSLIYGKSYELHYVDEYGKPRFDLIDTREGVPVYANTITRDILYFIRFYPRSTLDSNDGYVVEVYDGEYQERYYCGSEFTGLILQSREPHHYGQVPVIVLPLNDDEYPIFYKIMGLQDAYNTLLSGEVDDFEAFCDAYLALTGMEVDEENVQAMKENRVLVIPEGGDAKYITKSVSDTQIQNMLQNINDTIHKIANSPDFSQESFGVSSGIALRFRLLGFENTASAIASNFKKALQKRIELICTILGITGSDDVWRDVDIIIDRNIPVNETEAANMVNTLRGLVSDKTLLTQLPFIADADAEMEAVKAQKAENMELYSFGGGEAEMNGETQRTVLGGEDIHTTANNG